MEPRRRHYGLIRTTRSTTTALLALDRRRRENIAGYFAGHTHSEPRASRPAGARRARASRSRARKDYPGAWAEYRVYEGGYTQVMRRIAAPAALEWSERVPHMIQGIYRDLVLGTIDDRCFTQLF